MGSEVSSVKTLPGAPPLEIVCRVSARARRISLRVSSLDGRVTLTRPRSVPEAEALRFAHSKADWLRAQTGRVPQGQVAMIGATVPLGGVPHTVVVGRPGLGEGVLRVRAGRAVGPQVAAIVKEVARAGLADAVARHAGTLGRSPGRLTLRDTRSRWGSCNHRGDLMFSWRLAMAPGEVLDYVAAHEVAHLQHMDHSSAFWAACARLRPDWRNQRDWLRTNGATLHAWRFDA